jgi:hypothetical protein
MDCGNEATRCSPWSPWRPTSILEDDREHVGNPRVTRLGCPTIKTSVGRTYLRNSVRSRRRSQRLSNTRRATLLHDPGTASLTRCLVLNVSSSQSSESIMNLAVSKRRQRARGDDGARSLGTNQGIAVLEGRSRTPMQLCSLRFRRDVRGECCYATRGRSLSPPPSHPLHPPGCRSLSLVARWTRAYPPTSL